MQTAKCEGCETEIKFETYCHDWPAGWVLTGSSRWGKKYHRRGGYAWWCPKCYEDRELVWLNEMPEPVRRAFAIGLTDGDKTAHIGIVQLLIEHLPDSTHEDKTWDYAWNELSDDAQEAVKAVRKAAWEFVSMYQLRRLQ